MAAGSAAERAETGGIQKARFRGREVVLTFSMQARFFSAPLGPSSIPNIIRCIACNPFHERLPLHISIPVCSSDQSS